MTSVYRYIPVLAGVTLRSVCSDMRLLDKSGRGRRGNEGPAAAGSSFSLS
jgi:hypothetical protein